MAPAGKVVDKDRGWRDLMRRAKDIARGGFVKVGVLADGKGSEMVEGAGITLAELAGVHEFGTADKHVPERSFIRSSFDANVGKYRTAIPALLRRVVDGAASVDNALNALGMMVANDIKATVLEGEGVPPPLQPSTVERKMEKAAWNRAGKAATQAPRPLVDTGRMIGALSWAVERRK